MDVLKRTREGCFLDAGEAEQVVQRVKAGDQQAYAELIKAYERQMYTYCYGILSNREEAEDALQNIFITVYQNIGQYQAGTSFTSWLYKVAYHHSIDLIRKRKRWNRLIASWKEHQQQSPQPHETTLDELLMHLTAKERNLVMLKVVQQYSFEEIGQIMDMKPATLRKKYERVRKKLVQHNKTRRGISHDESYAK